MGGGTATATASEPPKAEEEEEKIYVAVGKDVNDAKSVLLWAIKNFPRRIIFLLHVHQPAQFIPFLGGRFPAHKLKEQEVRAFREFEKEQMHKMLNEYLFLCAQVEVRAEKLYIEMENVEKGIVELVSQHEIKRLIMGAAVGKNKKMIALKSKKAIFVSQQAHISCHIWFVCKGCLVLTREGNLVESGIHIGESPLTNPNTETFQEDYLKSRSITDGHHAMLTSPVQNLIRRIRPRGRRVATVISSDGTRATMMPQCGLETEESVHEFEKNLRESPSQGSSISSLFSSEVVRSLDSTSVVRDVESEDGSLLSSVQESKEYLRSLSPTNGLEHEGEIHHEMFDRLQQTRAEVQSSKREALEELFKRRKAEKDAIEAIHRAKESEILYANEVKQRKEMEMQLEKDTSELNKMRGQRDEVVQELRTALDQKMVLERELAESGQMLRELEDKIVNAVELLVTFKKERDNLRLERDNAVQEAEEIRKRRGEKTSSSQRQQFSPEFSFSEIDAATRNFDPCLIIGDGGYGTVYKGNLRNTDVAIKVLNSSSLQGRSEFQQEVDVLGRIRHPNLLTLIGTCPEVWSLVYEYLPNGNLQDRLFCKDNAPPLSWQIRVRIAVDICSALVFLHSNKPHGVVHGDLKPGNILLDANFVSKLGDFGICRLLTGKDTATNSGTLCCRTDNPQGTILYMDPEFLSAGELTPKSDVYSFGVVLLQLLTGRPAFGIAKEVQNAIDEEVLGTLVDPTAGVWPFVLAKQLAHLALRCCEIERKNRPDLVSDVWRVLEPMKASCGTSASLNLGSEELCQIPSYFICPIFQDIMCDPRVAADGFTYEAEAIKGWMDGGHKTSPMTNLELAHCDLIPNHSLRSAIEEWRQQHN